MIETNTRAVRELREFRTTAQGSMAARVAAAEAAATLAKDAAEEECAELVAVAEAVAEERVAAESAKVRELQDRIAEMTMAEAVAEEKVMAESEKVRELREQIAETAAATVGGLAVDQAAADARVHVVEAAAEAAMTAARAEADARVSKAEAESELAVRQAERNVAAAARTSVAAAGVNEAAARRIRQLERSAAELEETVAELEGSVAELGKALKLAASTQEAESQRALLQGYYGAVGRAAGVMARRKHAEKMFRVVSRLVRSWAAWAARRCKLRALSARLEMARWRRRAGAVLRAWRRRARQRTWHKLAVVTMRRRGRELVAAAAAHEWRRVTLRRVRARRVLTASKRHAAAKCLRAWAAVAAVAAVTSKSVEAMRTVQLASSLAAVQPTTAGLAGTSVRAESVATSDRRRVAGGGHLALQGDDSRSQRTGIKAGDRRERESAASAIVVSNRGSGRSTSRSVRLSSYAAAAAAVAAAGAATAAARARTPPRSVTRPWVPTAVASVSAAVSPGLTTPPRHRSPLRPSNVGHRHSSHAAERKVIAGVGAGASLAAQDSSTAAHAATAAVGNTIASSDGDRLLRRETAATAAAATATAAAASYGAYRGVLTTPSRLSQKARSGMGSDSPVQAAHALRVSFSEQRTHDPRSRIDEVMLVSSHIATPRSSSPATRRQLLISTPTPTSPGHTYPTAAAAAAATRFINAGTSPIWLPRDTGTSPMPSPLWPSQQPQRLTYPSQQQSPRQQHQRIKPQHPREVQPTDAPGPLRASELFAMRCVTVPATATVAALSPMETAPSSPPPPPPPPCQESLDPQAILEYGGPGELDGRVGRGGSGGDGVVEFKLDSSLLKRAARQPAHAPADDSDRAEFDKHRYAAATHAAAGLFDSLMPSSSSTSRGGGGALVGGVDGNGFDCGFEFTARGHDGTGRSYGDGFARSVDYHPGGAGRGGDGVKGAGVGDGVAVAVETGLSLARSLPGEAFGAMSASLDLAGRLMAGAEFSGEEVEARHRQQQHQQQYQHEHEPGVRQGGTLWANSQQQHHHHHPRRYEGEGWREREGGKTVAGGGEAALTQRGMWSTSSVAHISGAGGGSGDDSPQGTRRALWTGSRAVGDDNA